MRLLILMIMFQCPGALAINCDLLIHFESMPRPGVVYTDFNGGSYGWRGTWHNETLSRFSVVADTMNKTFPFSLTVSNITFTGSGTNMLQEDTGNAGGAGVQSAVVVLGGAEFQWGNLIVCGFFRANVTSVSDDSIDGTYAYGEFGGGWTVTQFRPKATSFSIRSHADINGSSSFGPEISLATNHVYYYTMLTDHTNGIANLKIFDAENNFAFITNSSCASTVAVDVYNWRFYAGYLQKPEGNIQWGDTALFYQPSAATIAAVNGPFNLGTTNTVTTLNAGTVYLRP